MKKLIILCMMISVLLLYGVAEAQRSSLSLEGGYGIYFTQSPETSYRGDLGIKFGSFYHSSAMTQYNKQMYFMKFAASSMFGLYNHVEINGMVTGFAKYLHAGDHPYQTGLGIGKIGMKIELPATRIKNMKQGIKFNLLTPAGAILVNQPTYLYDGNFYAWEMRYLSAFELSQKVETLINLGYRWNDLQNKWNMNDLFIASVACKWQYRPQLHFLFDLFTQTVTDSKFDFMKDNVQLSLGMQYFVLPKIGIEAGYMRTFNQDGIVQSLQIKDDWQIHLGVSLHFETFIPDYDHDGISDRRDMDLQTPSGWKVDAYGVPIDSDRDGVPDAIDREMLTTPGAIVDEFGIAYDSDHDGVPDGLDQQPDTPLGALVNLEGVLVDSDADGVANGLDSEPNTPFGALVDQQGRSLDSDSDGVPDGLDQEENTPIGVIVDLQGRMVNIKQVFLSDLMNHPLFGIYFEFDSSKLQPSCIAVLDQIGEFLNENGNLKLEITGFADSIGTMKYNAQLSQRRADRVQKYLNKKYSIENNRFSVKGFGEVSSTDGYDKPLFYQRKVSFKFMKNDVIVNTASSEGN